MIGELERDGETLAAMLRDPAASQVTWVTLPEPMALEETADALGSMADQIPHLVAMFMEVAHDDPGSTLGWCDDQTEFEFGLDLILDGLDKMRKPA